MISVGTRVKTLRPVDGKYSIQYEIGKVIYIGRRCLIEYEKNICGHNGNGLGKERKCWMCGHEVVKEV